MGDLVRFEHGTAEKNSTSELVQLSDPLDTMIYYESSLANADIHVLPPL